MAFNPKGLEMTKKYVANRMKGLNKKESALRAGYAESVALRTHGIEDNANYAMVLSKAMLRNSYNIDKMLTRVYAEINEDKPSKDIKDSAEVLLKLAQTQKILSPEVKIKEEKDKDGNTKRTIWATTGADASKVDENVTE